MPLGKTHCTASTRAWSSTRPWVLELLGVLACAWECRQACRTGASWIGDVLGVRYLAGVVQYLAIANSVPYRYQWIGHRRTSPTRGMRSRQQWRRAVRAGRAGAGIASEHAWSESSDRSTTHKRCQNQAVRHGSAMVWSWDANGLAMGWSWVGHIMVALCWPWEGHGFAMDWSLGWPWVGHGMVMRWSWAGHGSVMVWT